MSLIPNSVESSFSRLLNPFIRTMARSKIRPNSISTLGFLSNLVAGSLLFEGRFFAAGVSILFAGILDFADGKVARLTHQVSVYGAVYDATVDRIGELAIFTGIGAFLIMHRMYPIALIAAFALGGSMLISYVRARAESYNISCNIGLLRRADRIVLIGISAMFNFLGKYFHGPIRQLGKLLSVHYASLPLPLTLVIITIAVLSPVTVVQRLMHIRLHDSGGVRTRGGIRNVPTEPIKWE